MNFKFRPILKHIYLTFITEAVVLVGFLFIYRLIAKNFGPDGVGEYALIKKVLALFLPLLTLGLGIGLPRYIAISKNKIQRISYVRAAYFPVAFCTLLFFLIINIFNANFAKIFFGGTHYAYLALPFSFFLVGLTLHSLVYAYFQGRIFVKTFNFLKAINLTLVPVGIFVILKNLDVGRAINLIGITTSLIALFFSFSFIKELFTRIKTWQFKKSLKELFYYSMPRIPCDFVLAGLLSLGPIFAAHFTSIQEVGYLALGQTLLRGIIGAIAPLGIILLPAVSNLISQGKHETVKEGVNLIIGAILQCSIFVCAQILIFTDVIIQYWLGSEFSNAVPVMRIVFISTIFYAFYMSQRSILDAIKAKPLNMINVSISMVIFSALSGILLFLFKPFSPIISLSISFTSGLICLGILTYISIRKIYSENIKKDLNYLWIAILINILFGAVAIFLKSSVISKLYYLIIFEILLGMMYIFLLWLLKMDWIRQFAENIRMK